MNLNQGKRHKQAVQVLNKVEYDSEGNPVGMMEDPSNPASANFGTPRDPRRGGCYLGNGSAYITITGLLSTDTVEVLDGSDLPIISNDRLDIASGNRIFGVKIFRAGELWAKFNCSENSGDVVYDSSGNGNHGTIINAITTTPEENPNSIHQYQDVYSFENEEGYSKNGNTVIPKNSSITLPPFKDVLGNNLQYVGKVPGKAKFVGSSCFRGDGNGYILSNTNFNFISGFNFKFYIKLINVLETSAFLGARSTTGSGFRFALISNFRLYINAFGVTEYNISIPEKFRGLFCMIEVNYIYEGYLLELKINNELVFSGSRRIESGNEIICIGGYKYGNSISPSNSNIFLAGVELSIDDNLKSYFPLCEPITDPSNHIYHDVSGNGNHATLVNGTLANEGKQDEFHYLQRGLKNDDINQIVPILHDESGFADGSPLTDENAIQQDSHSFLNTGTELEAYDYPALKQADKEDDFWYEDDGLGAVTPKPVQFDSLITQNGLSDKLFLDSSVSETIKNVRMYGNDLKGRQLNTENKLTNN